MINGCNGCNRIPILISNLIVESIHDAINLCYRDTGTRLMVRESLNPNRALSIPTRDIKDHYARYRFCDLRDAGSLSIQSEIQKRRTDRASHTHAHAQAVPFNIPVAGGEPITLALKYGNRATGSAYRRLDKRCDARSIGPPTDRGASALARSRAPLFFILLLSVPPSCTRSARNHLLCT